MAAPHNSDHHTASWRQNKYLPPEKDGGKKKISREQTSAAHGTAQRHSLWGFGGRGYLGLAAGLQLVLVAAQPLVVEADVFGQRADLLQPHLLRERALNAVALVDHFALAQQRSKQYKRGLLKCFSS